MAEIEETRMPSHPGGKRPARVVKGIRKKLWLTALPVTIAFVSLFAAVPAYANGYMYSSQNFTLAPACSQFDIWPAQRATLDWQCDGNLVIYCNGTHQAVWSSETGGSAGYFAFQSDGNMVIYGQPGRQDPIWATGTNGHSGDYAVMQDDSNFVIYASPGGVLWASGTEGRC